MVHNQSNSARKLARDINRLNYFLPSRLSIGSGPFSCKIYSQFSYSQMSTMLRHWSGNTASRNKLLGLRYTGESLFGPDLKQIITDVTGVKSTFLPPGKKGHMEQPNNSTTRRTWSTPNRNFSLFTSPTFHNTSMDHNTRRNRHQWQHPGRQQKPATTKPTSI